MMQDEEFTQQVGLQGRERRVDEWGAAHQDVVPFQFRIIQTGQGAGPVGHCLKPVGLEPIGQGCKA